jgi:hypothetical protein
MGWHICAANDCLLAGNVASLLLLLLCEVLLLVHAALL